MSCGDLDGDVYFVTWNKDITDNISLNQIYPPAALQHDVNPEDQIITEYIHINDLPDHFCNFLEKDILGKAANMWVKMCQLKGEHGPNDR